MISDRAVAELVAAGYAPARDIFAWDVRIFVNQVRAFIKRFDGFDALIFPGTDDTEQWIRDIAAVPVTTDHPALGIVHWGFYLGMDAAHQEILKALRPDAALVIGGHSLGAAHAWYEAALMLLVKKPARIVVFGSPRPGFPQLTDVIRDAGIDATAYRNATPVGHDRVTDLPFSFPELPWTTPGTPVDICVPPAPGDNSPFRFHHPALYQQGAPDV